MDVKVYVVLVALVLAGVVTPLAHAQLSLNFEIGSTGRSFVVNINGTVPCSPAGPPVDRFADANVEVDCGSTEVASTTTNSTGEFEFVLATTGADAVPAVLSNCSLSVTTPLSFCNNRLPSTGTLKASLLLQSNITATGVNLVPGRFTWSSN